jgi:hypothetical protein
VGRLEAVDAHRDPIEPRGRHLRGERLGDPAGSGGHGGVHAGALERGDDLEETVVQVGLAADEHDLTRPHRRELGHGLERLGGGELVGALRAGARAAVGAGVIAAERELPDHVGREVVLREDVEATARRHSAQPGGCGWTGAIPSAPSQF